MKVYLWSTEHKYYLLACDYKTSIVNKHFDSVSSMSRDHSRAPQHKQVFNNKIRFISKYNLMLPNIYILHSGDKMKDSFPINSIATIH